MRTLPVELDKEILSQLLQGASYRAISRRLGISISTVARVAEDARKRAVDFDSLRGLAVLLKKVELTVFDVARANKLVEALNILGIGLDELDDYVKVSKRFLQERALNDDFILYAVKLMELEEATGQTCEKIAEDYEKKRREAAEAQIRKLAARANSSFIKKGATGKYLRAPLMA